MTKVSNVDISSFLSNILSWHFKWFKWAYDTLDSISFRGISLLDYAIWVFVLGIILPLIVTLLNSGRSFSEGYFKRERSAAKSEATFQRHEAERAARREAERKNRRGG